MQALARLTAFDRHREHDGHHERKGHAQADEPERGQVAVPLLAEPTSPLTAEWHTHPDRADERFPTVLTSKFTRFHGLTRIGCR